MVYIYNIVGTTTTSSSSPPPPLRTPLRHHRPRRTPLRRRHHRRTLFCRRRQQRTPLRRRINRRTPPRRRCHHRLLRPTFTDFPSPPPPTVWNSWAVRAAAVRWPPCLITRNRMPFGDCARGTPSRARYSVIILLYTHNTPATATTPVCLSSAAAECCCRCCCRCCVLFIPKTVFPDAVSDISFHGFTFVSRYFVSFRVSRGLRCLSRARTFVRRADLRC